MHNSSDGMVWLGLVVWYGGLVWWIGMVDWYGLVCFGMFWYGLVWFGLVWFGMVWYGLVWYGLVWFGLVWYGLVWLERTCKTSNVDFHMVWTQVRQLSILRTFEGRGGVGGVKELTLTLPGLNLGLTWT